MSKERDYWLAAESKWFRSHHDDLAAYKREGGTPAEYAACLIPAFYEAHQYRHPRATNHVRATVAQRKSMLFGETYYHFLEKTRHKLNFEQKKGKTEATERSLPPPETDASIQERLGGLGFVHAGSRSPYSRDATLQRFEQLTATRLGAYPDIDYAAVNNEQRAQALKDLPGDLEDIATVLSVQTGAEIWAVGVWRDPDGRLMFSSVQSPYSRAFKLMQAHETGLSSFYDWQMTYNALLMSPTAADARPVPYASFDGSFRPLLPYTVFNEWTTRRLSHRFLEMQYAYQGLHLPLLWDKRKIVLVNPRRLPAGMDSLTHPDTWNSETTLAFVRHLTAGQRSLLSNDNQFQFLGAVDVEDDIGLYSPNPEHISMRAAPDARLFVARLLNLANTDLLTYREIANQLPAHDEGLPVYDVFSAPDYAHLLEVFDYSAPYKRLLAHVVQYKRGFPPQLPEPLSSMTHLGTSFWLDAVCYNPHHSQRWSLLARGFSAWLRASFWTHALTGALLGGPYGLKWLALMLGKFEYSCHEQERRQPIPHRTPTAPDLREERHVMDSDIEWLTVHIENSASKIVRVCERDVSEVVEPVSDEEVFEAERHEAPEILSATPSPAPSPPPAARSALKGKGRLARRKKEFAGIVILPYSSRSRASSRASAMEVDENVAGPSGLQAQQTNDEEDWEESSDSKLSTETDEEEQKLRTRAQLKRVRELWGRMPMPRIPKPKRR
ncbi:hypothetical protein FRC09_018215 [Ceratobasidium sp. 395]|nr:hypothetical protein FRC09_018215 [Ceratobasidium sp. 395]